MGCFSGSVEKKQVSNLSRAQQGLSDAASRYLTENIGQGAEAYGGQLTADMPAYFQEAYDQFTSGQFGEESFQAIQDLISGRPAYEFDPVKTASRWKETYANPIMESWRETVLPSIREQMNMPGTLYSRGTSDYVSTKASQFYEGQVAPTLYNTLSQGEALGAQASMQAKGMQPGALSLPYQQFMQQAGAAGTVQAAEQMPLTAAYNEFLRTRAEPGWAVNAAQGFLSSTIDTGMFREPSLLEQIGPAAAAGIGAYAASDEKLKEDIKSIDDALAIVNQLDGKMFKFIDGPKSGGVVAQEVEKVLPDIIGEKDGYKTVDYHALIGILINAVKELDKRI